MLEFVQRHRVGRDGEQAALRVHVTADSHRRKEHDHRVETEEAAPDARLASFFLLD